MLGLFTIVFDLLGNSDGSYDREAIFVVKMNCVEAKVILKRKLPCCQPNCGKTRRHGHYSMILAKGISMGPIIEN